MPPREGLALVLVLDVHSSTQSSPSTASLSPSHLQFCAATGLLLIDLESALLP
jgi:hypothetical protein